VPTWSSSGEWILFDTDVGYYLRSPDGRDSRKLPGDLWIVATFSNDGKTMYDVQRGKPDRNRCRSQSRVVKVLHPLEMKDIPSTQGSPTMKLSLALVGKSFTCTSFKGDGVLWLLSGLGAGR
jgi:hypothetical protein